jgi:hypothetical protein
MLHFVAVPHEHVCEKVVIEMHPSPLKSEVDTERK